MNPFGQFKKRSNKNQAGLIVLIIASLFLFSCTKKVDDKDDTINYPLRDHVKGLDPTHLEDLYSATVSSHIFETLLEYHYLKRPLTLQPLLAASMPVASNNGLTHTFKIKKEARFHDSEAFPNGKGRPVTSHDFIYSWKRIADPKNRSEKFWIFDGKIKGLNEWREKVSKGKADYSTPIEGFQAPDDHTLVIHLTKPYYQLYYVLAMAGSSVVPKEAVEKYGKSFMNHPVGTGPYQFQDWVRGNKITLVKNPHWHGQKYPSEGEPSDQKNGLLKDAGQSLPFAHRVVFHEFNEDQPRWLNFMKGHMDISRIPKDNFDSAVQGRELTPDMKKKKIHLQIVTEPDVTFMGFNLMDSVLSSSADLRRAMSLAYDTSVSIEKFYNGRAIDAQSPIPPDIDGYDPQFKNPYKEYNLSKAKEFLKKAGYPEGKGLPVIDFAATSSSTARQMAEYFKQSMAKIGVKVKISTSSWPQFLSKVRENKTQVYGMAWAGDYPDAENFLQLLYGPNKTPGPNGTNFDNEKFNELYKKASHLPPGPERSQIYKQMRNIVVDQAPWIPGVHRLGYYFSHGWVQNYKPHLINLNFLKYVRVDPKMRAKLKAAL